MTLACEDANSKLAEIVTVAHVDAFVQAFEHNIGKDFEVEVQARF